jgi:hypothetical protein
MLALSAGSTWAQNRKAKPDEVPPQYRTPHPADKVVQRYYTIDQKRRNEDMYTEEALPRSREFKRIDSTYYVGWMFEGVYKFEHAADYLGYKSAIPPLARALNLLEHDYAKALATRTNELMTYYPVYSLHIDYTVIANYLMNCYANTDQPVQAEQVIRRALKWNFQNQFNMDAYNYLAWTVHRNRFYTHDKYSFLKNTIEENEQLAQKYLDSAMRRIRLNAPLNEQFQPSVAESEKIGVYHYRNMLYSYSFQIDSSIKYFELMRKAGRLPHNNYATFKAVCGDFRTAESEYKIASAQDAADKRLQEWAYYSSILNLYKGLPKEGAQLARDMIRAAGTTPGYGWYNIALARSLMYDGQIAEAKRYTERAAEFKELHIGTTLGQSHYEFSIQLLKLVEKEMDIASQRFENANWWYNPKVLIKTGGLTSDKFAQQFLIMNQFAQNPERDRVIYKLFSNESTVSWDEIWYLISDYSTKYFINRFQREALTDKRPAIQKYFKLFVARLKMKQGNFKDAKIELDRLTQDKLIDKEYEKLYIARLYQAEAECAKELKYTSEYDEWMYRLYCLYPQLIPFTGMKANMGLRISGSADATVTERLKNCSINWTTNSSIPAPTAYISFGTKGKTKIINYYVVDRNGNYIVPKQSFSWNKAEDAGIALAYKLFNTGSTTEGQ